MNCTDFNANVHDYIDGELATAEARAIETHAAGCAACAAALASLQSLRASTRALDREIAPARNLWAGIAEKIEVERVAPNALSGRAHASRAQTSGLETSRSTSEKVIRFFVPLAIAASLALLVSWPRDAGTARGGWAVASVSGAPRIGTQAILREGKFGVGQVLVTDAASRAKVSVGAIGEVTIEENSRVRLVDASSTDHRLALERGTLRAFIWAPPRLFFVETPSATAIDLGCAYTLNVADNGDSELHVTTGYVALEHDGRESFIPARAMCVTRAGFGPGTPFAETAPAEFRAALGAFDFTPGAGNVALRRILAQVRAEDAVTLWHLLARTQGEARGRVFDALEKVHPAPATVTRAGILRGDVAMRRAWAEGLGFGTFVSR